MRTRREAINERTPELENAIRQINEQEAAIRRKPLPVPPVEPIDGNDELAQDQLRKVTDNAAPPPLPPLPDILQGGQNEAPSAAPSFTRRQRRVERAPIPVLVGSHAAAEGVVKVNVFNKITEPSGLQKFKESKQEQALRTKLSQTLDVYQYQNSIYQAQTNGIRQEIAKLGGIKAKKEGELLTIPDEEKSIKKDLSNLQAAVERIALNEPQRDAFARRVEEMQPVVERLQQQFDDFKATINDDNRQEKQDELGQMQGTLTQNKDQLNIARRKITEIDNKAETNRQLLAKQQELAGIGARKNALKAEIEGISRQIDEQTNSQRKLLETQQKILAQMIPNIRQQAKEYSSALKPTAKSQTMLRKLMQIDESTTLRDVRDGQEQNWHIPFDLQLANASKLLNTGTASQVYKVQTNGPIAPGYNDIGYAKKSLGIGEQANDTTINLGIPKDSDGKLKESPNLIARQVLSYKLDEAIGLGVTTYETSSYDSDGKLIGISANAADRGATQVMINVSDEDQLHSTLNFKNRTTQKMLSDLQLLDAITGQMDRHLGNIFINSNTGEVFAIDNDMAFPEDTLAIAGNQLRNQFEIDNESKKLIFKQELIDADSAQKILSLTPTRLTDILSQKVGNEQLPQASIDSAIERLLAVQDRIKFLGSPEVNGLIREWDDDKTFNRAIDNGIADTFQNRNSYSNYIAEAQIEWERANSGNFPGKVVRL